MARHGTVRRDLQLKIVPSEALTLTAQFHLTAERAAANRTAAASGKKRTRAHSLHLGKGCGSLKSTNYTDLHRLNQTKQTYIIFQG